MNKRQAKKRGRKSGVPNMVRTESGDLINKYGVVFTEEEKKALVSAVNSANRKRNKMLKDYADLPRIVGHEPSGDSNMSLQRMGKESDFIITKKTKSLQRFKSKDQFNSYMDYLKRVNNRNYITEKTEFYRNNYLKGLREKINADTSDIEKAIRSMSAKDYMRTVEANEDLEISFLYSPADIEAKLSVIRHALGLDTPDYLEIVNEDLPY